VALYKCLIAIAITKYARGRPKPIYAHSAVIVTHNRNWAETNKLGGFGTETVTETDIRSGSKVYY